jgi:hypothetical protein
VVRVYGCLGLSCWGRTWRAHSIVCSWPSWCSHTAFAMQAHAASPPIRAPSSLSSGDIRPAPTTSFDSMQEHTYPPLAPASTLVPCVRVRACGCMSVHMAPSCLLGTHSLTHSHTHSLAHSHTDRHPLTHCVCAWWAGRTKEAMVLLALPPPAHAALLRDLRPQPGWSRDLQVQQVLEPLGVYGLSTDSALALASRRRDRDA